MNQSTTSQPNGSVLPSEARAQGYILVSGPYRPDEEDWMLRRVVVDLERGGMTVVLVWQRARADRGGYMGLSVWRKKGVAQ